MEASQGHRRTASTKNATAAKLHHHHNPIITLFLTNLRLLDLDLLPDYPTPTPTAATFHPHSDARLRTRTTEFALYHLFRLYDPATTAEKLRPFYPPLEPLQSINLRAALFRCLNELKKNGILGRETVLRKSLVEECSGDRLWEVCLAFSAVVLRKVVLERKKTYAGHRQGGPVAERLGTGASGYGNAAREGLLVSLGLAHRVSLGRQVEERKRKAEGFTRVFERLGEKGAELEERRKVVRERESARPSEKSLRRLEGVEESIKRSWVGSEQLRHVLLDGQTEKDDLLYKSLDASNGTTLPSTHATTGLLQTLSRTVDEQNERVRRWQTIHDDLLAKKHSRSKSSATAIEAVGLRFEKHRDLGLRDAPMPTSSAPPRQRSDSAMKMSAQYDDILTSMREQLRHQRQASEPLSPSGKSAEGANKPQTRPRPSRHSSLHISTSSETKNSTIPGAQDPRPYLLLLQTHNRSPSETAVPMRRPFHVSRRSSSIKPSHPSRSNSRSYTAPKVESQRGVIPLKSEVFSPVKSRVGSWHGGSGDWSALGTPVETPMEEEREVGVVVGVGVGVGLADGSRGGDEEAQAVSHDSGVDMGIVKESPGSSCDDGEKDVVAAGHAASSSPTPLVATVAASPEATSSSSSSGSQSASPSAISAPAPALVPAVRPSLAERTRMSMAFRSLEDVKDVRKSEVDILPISAEEEGVNDDSGDVNAKQKRRETLLERTRRSILVAPASASTAEATAAKKKDKQKPLHTRARSSIHPVNNTGNNHHTTAHNSRRSSIPNLLLEEENEHDDKGEPGTESVATPKRKLRDITPREQLFSPDAEYSSVFKPRPKIKMSPVLSPLDDAEGDEPGFWVCGGEGG
ncbi:hypothetical protein LTR78_001604 [Recurvomyces mirabilis]|uniref:HAUS augmin-like complex subunit 6 N-terminal domain-containing protein n=1 Tax=Recurvomyces mirabilis TaxID=574656 RepID=A0AAE0WUI0_9PEZI|nr:hypothetical protein LTR78_001604 [Recurvomyces mirabilis]KAK5151824.1 hypothetical protein LTS14_008958 [Recurvomyces mirabilis]